jgi:hypothetical protein
MISFQRLEVRPLENFPWNMVAGIPLWCYEVGNGRDNFQFLKEFFCVGLEKGV